MFENRLAFGKDRGKSRVAPFFPDAVYFSVDPPVEDVQIFVASWDICLSSSQCCCYSRLCLFHFRFDILCTNGRIKHCGWSKKHAMSLQSNTNQTVNNLFFVYLLKSYSDTPSVHGFTNHQPVLRSCCRFAPVLVRKRIIAAGWMPFFPPHQQCQAAGWKPKLWLRPHPFWSTMWLLRFGVPHLLHQFTNVSPVTANLL